MNFTQAWVCCQLRDLIQCFRETAFHGGGMVSQKINLPSIGQVVKAWRLVRRLSVTELGIRAGLPRAYISQVEHGKVHQPGDENLARIANALKIPVEYLVVRRLPDMETQTVDGDFTFGAPRVTGRKSKSNATTCADTLKDVLQEINEISMRLEQLRRVVEAHLSSEERVK
jgi:transcriptional regulator with XRE-family HTH domain